MRFRIASDSQQRLDKQDAPIALIITGFDLFGGGFDDRVVIAVQKIPSRVVERLSACARDEDEQAPADQPKADGPRKSHWQGLLLARHVPVFIRRFERRFNEQSASLGLRAHPKVCLPLYERNLWVFSAEVLKFQGKTRGRPFQDRAASMSSTAV